MLRWILGGLLVLVVLVGGTCWYGYKKVTAGGDTAEVVIAGSPERVYASLTHPDSMALWMSEGTTISPRGRDLAVGDTLRFAGRVGDRGGARQDMMWVVRELAPPHRVVLAMASDTLDHALIVRRDELVARNDSTVVVSTFASPALDSARASGSADSSRMASWALDASGKLVVGAIRMATEADLRRLKARVEGTAMP